MSRREKVYLLLFFAGAFLAMTATTYFGFGIWYSFQDSKTQTVKAEVVKTKVSKIDGGRELLTFLLLGAGGAGHSGGGLSDVLIVLAIDPVAKKVGVITIPRDLWVSIPTRSDISERHKINAAHAIGGDDKKYPLKQPEYRGEHGGGNMAKRVVSDVLGFEIGYYGAIDFSSFESAIDKLGGVEVDVPYVYDDHFYPVKGLENESCGKTGAEIAELSASLSGFELEKQFECRYEHLHFDPGPTTVDGATALKFSRSRHGETHGGDFERSKRQVLILNGVAKIMMAAGAIEDPTEYFDILGEFVKSDVDVGDIIELVRTIGDPTEYEVVNVNLSSDNVLVDSRSGDGQYVLIPKSGDGNWEEIQEYVAEKF